MPVKIRWLISYFYAPKFLIGVIAFIHKDGQLLLLKNKYQYDWSLPGGFIKKGEDIHSAIKREIKEEVGLIVVVKRVLDIKNSAKKSILDIILDCEIVGGSLKIDEKEVEQAKFYNPDSIPDLISYEQEDYVKQYKKFS